MLSVVSHRVLYDCAQFARTRLMPNHSSVDRCICNFVLCTSLCVCVCVCVCAGGGTLVGLIGYEGSDEDEDGDNPRPPSRPPSRMAGQRPQAPAATHEDTGHALPPPPPPPSAAVMENRHNHTQPDRSSDTRHAAPVRQDEDARPVRRDEEPGAASRGVAGPTSRNSATEFGKNQTWVVGYAQRRLVAQIHTYAPLAAQGVCFRAGQMLHARFCSHALCQSGHPSLGSVYVQLCVCVCVCVSCAGCGWCVTIKAECVSR